MYIVYHIVGNPQLISLWLLSTNNLWFDWQRNPRFKPINSYKSKLLLDIVYWWKSYTEKWGIP